MPVIYVDPLNTSYLIGENFTISVKIFNLTNSFYLSREQWAPGETLPPPDSRFNYSLGNLYGLDIQLSWNVSVLEYVNHTVKIPVEDYPDGVLHQPIFDFMDLVGNGTYWLAKTSSFPAAAFNCPNENATVFEMTFRAKQIGQCVFNITKSDLGIPVALPGYAAAYAAIPHLVESEYIQIIPEFSTPIFLSLLLIATLFTTIFYKFFWAKR